MRKKTSFFDFLTLYDVALDSWTPTISPREPEELYHGWGASFDAADYMPIYMPVCTKKAWKWLIDSTRVFIFCEMIYNISLFTKHQNCFYALGDDYPLLNFIEPMEGGPFKTRAQIYFKGRSAKSDIMQMVTQASDEIKRLMTGRQGNKLYLRDDPETERLLNELRRDFFDTDISLAKELGISKSTFEAVFQSQSRGMTLKIRDKIREMAELKGIGTIERRAQTPRG